MDFFYIFKRFYCRAETTFRPFEMCIIKLYIYTQVQTPDFVILCLYLKGNNYFII